jgi:hypothetical protein
MNLSKMSLILLITTVASVGFSAGLLTAHFQVRQFVRREFRLPPPPEGEQDPVRIRHREQMRKRMIDDLTIRLNLDQPQRERVQAIMDWRMKEMHGAEEKFKQSMHGIMEHTDREILNCLNPEQQRRFEEMRRHFRPGPPPR